jgi:hypothetical protein
VISRSKRQHWSCSRAYRDSPHLVVYFLASGHDQNAAGVTYLAASPANPAGDPSLTVSSPSSLCEPSDLDRSARTNHLCERVLDDLTRPDPIRSNAPEC